jgi:hypothetical protein
MVGRREGALDKEHRSAADAVFERGLELPVTELVDLERTEFDGLSIRSSGFLKILYNLLCKSLRSPAAENQHSVFVLHN